MVSHRLSVCLKSINLSSSDQSPARRPSASGIPLSRRSIQREEIKCISTLCLAVFTHSVAPSLLRQGSQTFSRMASPEYFFERMKAEYLIFVFEEADKLKGIVELKNQQYITILFVAPGCQNQGIGAALITAILQQAKAAVVTVNVSPNAVPAYRRYGFEYPGETGESAGQVYQPMAIHTHGLIHRV